MNDVLNPTWMRWREFLCAFLHFVRFVDQTDENEDELRNLKKELSGKKVEFAKIMESFENPNESDEEFVLDEKEISLNETLPVIQNQYNSLINSKSLLETETTTSSEKLKQLQEELNSLQQELEQWKVQVVKSPGKI